MNNVYCKKVFVFGIIFLLLGVVVLPIMGSSENINIFNSHENFFFSDMFYPADDVCIRKGTPDQNLDGWPNMNVRNDHGFFGPGNQWDSLIKFDISSYPPGSTVESATLNLYYSEWTDTNPQGRPLYLYRILDDWDEGVVTWNTQPSYASQPSTFAVVPSFYSYMHWDVTDDIQDFIDGDYDNYGWKVTDEIYWGFYDIPVTRLNTKDGPQIPYLEIKLEEPQSNPPDKPTISGPPSGNTGVSYVYSSATTDPDGDKIYYFFNWGDGTDSGWVGPYDSGDTTFESNIWNSEGSFILKVKASDINGVESSWSDVLIINMPRIRASLYPYWYSFLERLPILNQLIQLLE